MRLTVRLRHRGDCNASLPRHVANSLASAHRRPGALGLLLTWADASASSPLQQQKQALVGWSGECSTAKDELELGAHLAGSLGLRDGAAVNVEALADGLPTATTAMVEPVSADDWEVIELHQQFLEERLLAQVQFVFEGETLPLWVLGDTVAFVAVTQLAGAEITKAAATAGGGGAGAKPMIFARLARDGQVVVAPKPRALPKAAQQQERLSKWLRAEPASSLAASAGPSLPGFVVTVCVDDFGSASGGSVFVATFKESAPAAAGTQRKAVVRAMTSGDVPKGVVRLAPEAAASLGCHVHSLLLLESLPALPVPTRIDMVTLQELRPARSKAASPPKPADAAVIAEFKLWFARTIGASPEPVAVFPSFVARLLDDRAFNVFVNCDPSAPNAGNPIALFSSSIHVATKFIVMQAQGELHEMADTIHPNLDGVFLERFFGGYEAEFGKASKHCDALTDKTLLRKRVSELKSPGLPGLLIVGSRGTGRTCLAMTLAGRLFRSSAKAFVGYLSCTRLSSRQPVRGRGETPSEAMARVAWECVRHAPAVLVLDDLEALAPAPSEGQSAEEQPVVEAQTANAVSELLGCLADTYSRRGVAVVATAQAVSSLHPLLRGPGAFAEIIELETPSPQARELIVRSLAERKRASVDQDFCATVARETEGFVAADLSSVVERALHSCTTRGPESVLSAVDADFALEGFVPLGLMGTRTLPRPDVHWDDVGGLADVKKALKETLEWPSKFPQLFANCPIRMRSGVLLYGFPGCSKTLLAQAVAQECALNFIGVKGPELLSKYIGQSELAVRDLFKRARSARPSVLFFDELDALAPRRGHDTTGVTDRIVNQLLTQLDGVEALSGVYVLAATSRPDLVDPALLRPGRIDTCLFCGFPSNASEREEVLRAIARKTTTLSEDVDLAEIAREIDGRGFSPADLRAVLYTAQLDAVKECLADANKQKSGECATTSKPIVTKRHIEAVLASARPSLSPQDRRHFAMVYAEFIKSHTGVSAGGSDPTHMHQPRQTLA